MRWALVGTAIVLLLVLIDVARHGANNPVSLVQPGEIGPSAAVFHEDFPKLELLEGGGHDGQQFYAIARNPLHPSEVAPHLDRPRYRLQRPLYPVLAWLLHPGGGGMGLVLAMFAVGASALFVGGLAMGHLSVRWGGPAWMGALFPLLPGCYVSLRISTADLLALALGLLAVALSFRRTGWPALLAAVAAVLAKESTLLLLLAFALWRRDRRGWLLVSWPGITAAAWWLWLRVTLQENGVGVIEFTLPFRGLATSAEGWADGDDLSAFAAVALAVGLGVVALWRRGLRAPLGWAVLAHLALVVVVAPVVIGLNLNGTRATMPLLACSLLTLASRASPPRTRIPTPLGP